MSEERNQQIVRLEEAQINLDAEEVLTYLEQPDVISEEETKLEVLPVGYKRCGKCKQVKKFYLFNRNLNSRINCTGNCKDCQKANARVSYDKNKGKRDYKKYYEEHKDLKREHGRSYYQRNRDKILAKHRDYRGTQEGKEAMNRAHVTRKKAMKTNVGIPYTREIVIERDKLGGEFPVCCLCGKFIENFADIHMEHLIPIRSGGADCFTNVACAHSKCNLEKTKDAEEITVEQVETIEKRAEQYIDEHPEHFPDFL